MKRTYLITLLVAVLALFGAASAQAGKQAICHFPPGNEANFHTIFVSDNAVDNHVAKHEDLVGTCLENCEAACDDEDFCTQDVQADPDECICLAEPRPAVNCDDSNPCTADSCDSNLGACVYDTALPNGDPCDDGDPDTTDDVCTDGVCQGTSAVSCPCEGIGIWDEVRAGYYDIDSCDTPPYIEEGVAVYEFGSFLAAAGSYTSQQLRCDVEPDSTQILQAGQVAVCVQQLVEAAAAKGVTCPDQ